MRPHILGSMSNLEAVEGTTDKNVIVGKVSGATFNFTVVEFYNSAGTAGIETDTIFFYITGVSDGGSTTFTNEIYPIYPGDTIVYAPGQSAQPSPTQSTTSTPTSTTAVAIHTPTIAGVTLNAWPTTGATEPLPQGKAYTDVLPQSPNYLTDYHVIAQNVQTLAEFEVCRVTGAPSNFILGAFVDEAGNPGYSTDVIFIYPDAVLSATALEINEVYPIWLGDYIVDPNA
ncbi:hypothetical protein NHQ30_002962 [Ciborinia camelliae]|nr:hypothetical protein NHQ30_002962 [Ciborinia camelliae]